MRRKSGFAAGGGFFTIWRRVRNCRILMQNADAKEIICRGGWNLLGLDAVRGVVGGVHGRRVANGLTEIGAEEETVLRCVCWNYS